MEKIILKRKILELQILTRKKRPLKDLSNEELLIELNLDLDRLNLINKLISECEKDENIQPEHYSNYLNLLEEEKYEELLKYEIID